jgi:tetratricopeptide (TPR) repeat protein
MSESGDFVMNNNGDGKIVYFPGLVQRLLEKGMDALKEKKHKEAKRFFYEVLEFESDDAQAHLGYILSMFGLGQLSDAKTQCEQMLREGIGDYYDTLQIYLSILVQLQEYDRAVEMLEAVLEENRLPPQMAESFYQLLEFSRKRRSEPGITEEPRGHTTHIDIHKQRELIESPDIEKQWIAIQNLSESSQSEATDLYKQFLKEEDKDPFLKSMILQILEKKDMKEPVAIEKFGRSMTVHPEDLSHLISGNFTEKVKNTLSTTLQQENPTLYEMALQVWEHFVTAMFPIDIEYEDESVWAGALFQVVHELNGIEVNDERIAERHDITHQHLLQAVEKIKMVENREYRGLE